MFELSVYLVVTLYSPQDRSGKTILRQEYHITENTQEALDAAGDECEADAHPWVRKALQVNRGVWMLDVACQVQHDEAEPAKGRE